MVSPYYNPKPLTGNTVARAEALNSEFEKIKAAFDKLPDPTAIGTGGGAANYTHYAYADSADGTSNFTTGAAGNRAYVGLAANQPSPTKSENPEDYTWTRIRGADGAGGTSTEVRYIRSLAPPTPATGNTPAGTSTSIPVGTDPLWMTSATRSGDGSLLSTWSPWERLSAYPPAEAYSATRNYYQGMQVLFAGGTYLLRAESSTGNAPSGTAQDNAWWSVAAAPGTAGPPATPPDGFVETIDLTTSATGVNLRSIADAAGYTGQGDATITFRVPNGVTITGVPGNCGIKTGSWPTNQHTIALSLVIQSGGAVRGGGGRGGDGGSAFGGQAGARGGCGLSQNVDLESVTVEAGGILAGGGGGGGGGRGTFSSGSGGGNGEFDEVIDFEDTQGAAGGGGGGGAPNGSGGFGGLTFATSQAANAGEAGTINGGGAGGAGRNEGDVIGFPGAAGGGLGLQGASTATAAGGAPGSAIARNGYASPLTNNGTVLGYVG